MTNQKKILSAAGALLLAGAGLAAQGTGTKPATSHAPAAQSKQALPSQSKASATKSATSAQHEVAGKVVSADATTLVISRMAKGKSEEMSFALSPETQKHGSVETGARVVVKYRVENGENVATHVTARSASAKHATQ